MDGKMKSMKEKETRRDERIRETEQAGIVSEARPHSPGRLQPSTMTRNSATRERQQEGNRFI